MNILRTSLTSLFVYSILCVAIPYNTHAQTLLLPQQSSEREQEYISPELYEFLKTYAPNSPVLSMPVYNPLSATTTTTTATSTATATSSSKTISSPKIEDISFIKTSAKSQEKKVSPVAPVVPTQKTTPSPTVKNVNLNDILTINITSQKDPKTPIDIFILSYTKNGTPIKRVPIKTVFNEEKGVTKKYKLTINSDLILELKNATSIRVGYCVNSCKGTQARMIVGNIILPTI